MRGCSLAKSGCLGSGWRLSLDLVPALAQVVPARSLFQLTKLSQPHLSPQHGRNDEELKEEKAPGDSPRPSVSQRLQFRKCQTVAGRTAGKLREELRPSLQVGARIGS